MTDSLELFRRPPAKREPPAAEPADADEEACAAFGFLRAARDRAAFLELRFADGNREAFPYSWLGPVWYDPSAGLVLRFVGDAVTHVVIEGSHLNTPTAAGVSLFEGGLLRQRVTWVREAGRHDPAADGQPRVDCIRVLGPEEPPPDPRRRPRPPAEPSARPPGSACR